jgi:hypothetical protein
MTNIDETKEAIEKLHQCIAIFVKSEPTKEVFQGKTVWEGIVQVFELKNHPTATHCYAWSHETEKRKRKFFAVLHQGPVDSPQAAVRAAIVAEYRNSKGGK